MKPLKIYFAVLFAALSTVTVFAHEFEVDGIYYNKNADETSVTVTYRGNSYNDYTNEYSGNVVIPSSVTYSGNTYAVTSIGEYAFSGCSGLTSVTIGNSVTSIGDWAFEYCSGLTSVIFNAENCNDLSYYVWSYSDNLTSFTIGDKVQRIPANLCYGLSKLTSITIPNSVTSIGDEAFYYCDGLTSVTIGNSVTSIGEFAFSLCSGLTSITIPNSVTSIGADAFSQCSGLTSVTIGNSVTSIGDYAFHYCSGLTSVIFNAENCNDLSYYVWSYSDNLTSFTIGDKVQRIPANLCCGLSKLTSLTIGNSVTSIGEKAFYGCDGLTSVIFNAENCKDLSECWPSDNLTSFTIGDKVQRIPAKLCYGLSKLTSITIPNSVTSIGDEAFYYCDGLTSITIPNSVTSIGNFAFYNCSGLTSISIPNSVTSIGEYAFYYCDGLTSISIPNSVTSIGGCAFSSCSGLTTISVESGNTVYDSRNNCNAIVESATNTLMSGCKNTIIPNSVTSIGKSAFKNCSGLTSITIPNSVTSIGYYAFYDCDNLSCVLLGNSVISVNDAFESCYGLIKCAYPETLPNPFESGITISYPADGVIDESGIIYDRKKENVYFVFIDAEKVELLNTVKSINNYAFYACNKLTSVSIPSSTDYLGNRAFKDCDKLELLKCDAVTPPSLGSDVFFNVNKSTCKLVVPDQSISLYKAAEQWKDFLNTSDAEMVTVDESGISVENGAIVNKSNQQIDVYSISGAKAYSGNDAEITLPSGIYVVKAGEKVVKLAL